MQAIRVRDIYSGIGTCRKKKKKKQPDGKSPDKTASWGRPRSSKPPRCAAKSSLERNKNNKTNPSPGSNPPGYNGSRPNLYYAHRIGESVPPIPASFLIPPPPSLSLLPFTRSSSASALATLSSLSLIQAFDHLPGLGKLPHSFHAIFIIYYIYVHIQGWAGPSLSFALCPIANLPQLQSLWTSVNRARLLIDPTDRRFNLPTHQEGRPSVTKRGEQQKKKNKH